MKTRSLLVIGIVALLCASGLKAQTTSQPLYASVSVGYAIPSWSNVDGGYGIGAAFGTVIKNHHYVELEAIYLKHDLNNLFPGESGNFTSIPVLATYRYAILFGNSGWSLQLGGSAGFASQKVKFSYRGSSDSTSKTVLALAGQALVVYKINDKFSAHAGVKAIWTDKMSSDDNSGTDTMPVVGASFHF